MLGLGDTLIVEVAALRFGLAGRLLGGDHGRIQPLPHRIDVSGEFVVVRIGRGCLLGLVQLLLEAIDLLLLLGPEVVIGLIGLGRFFFRGGH